MGNNIITKVKVFNPEEAEQVSTACPSLMEDGRRTIALEEGFYLLQH